MSNTADPQPSHAYCATCGGYHSISGTAACPEPQASPPSAFPHCEVCGSSAWHCSVCLPQPPSGCCVVGEAFLRELTEYLEDLHDSQPSFLFANALAKRCRAVLSQSCAHAAGSSKERAP